jgi:hypothetical protein
MPARTKSITKTKSATAVQVKKFELPALKFNAESLTDGTDIPPPAPSPKLEKVLTPPATPKEEKHVANGNANGTGHPDAALEATATATAAGGTKRPIDDLASPTVARRQGSLRRLFSRNLLNNAYANDEDAATIADPEKIIRPESSASGVFGEGKKSRRSSGWFSRLRSSDGASIKRSSIMSSEKRGPPPPMIPELSEFRSSGDKDTWGEGDDFFKNIN